ncbi:MAG: hypothetical protein ACLSVD_09400 [Eggerthellaceae bacterium]
MLLGNTGIFCWWSYVSWLTDIGGTGDAARTARRLGSAWWPGRSRAGPPTARRPEDGGGRPGDGWAALLLIFLFSARRPRKALMFLCAFGMFFASSPAAAHGERRRGGEMIGSACVPSIWAMRSAPRSPTVSTRRVPAWLSLAGCPCSLAAVVLLAVLFTSSRRYRPSTDIADRMLRQEVLPEDSHNACLSGHKQADGSAPREQDAIAAKDIFEGTP